MIIPIGNIQVKMKLKIAVTNNESIILPPLFSIDVLCITMNF